LEKVRAFIAVDIEEEKLKQGFVKLQEELLEEGADIKIVSPENIHITLRFLGELEENVVQRVVDGLKLLRFQPFDVQFKGVGAFPSLTHMNVIWVGIKKGGDELRNLAEALEPQLRKIGIPPDKKGFSPHVTVARVRTGRNKQQIAKRLAELVEQEFGWMKAESVRLQRSTLTPKGPIYSTIFEVKA